MPTRRTATASRLFGDGTDGTSFGHASADAPRPRMTARRSGARGQRRAAGERDDAVRADDDTRRREPVQREEARHHRERGADDDRPRVAAARAEHRPAGGCGGCDERAEPDRVEVQRAGEVDLVMADRRLDGGGSAAGRRTDREQQEEPAPRRTHGVPCRQRGRGSLAGRRG
jgi:hypothetical protein